MKKVLYLLLTLILVALAGMLTLTALISTDDIKQALISQVKQQTGRELFIYGPVSWSFYPSLGLSIEQVRLLNPAGFPAEPTVTVADGRIRVALLPLFSGQLMIEQLALNKPQIHLLRSAQGHSNLDDLLALSTGPGTPAAPASAKGAEGYQIQLAGIRIEDAELTLQDQATGQEYSLSHFTLETGAWSADQPVAIALATDWRLAQITGHVETQLQLQQQAQGSRWLARDWKLNMQVIPSDGKQVQLMSQGDAQLDLRTDGGYEVALPGWQLTTQLTSPDLTGSWKSQGDLRAYWDDHNPHLLLEKWQLSGQQTGPTIPKALETLAVTGEWRYEHKASRLSLERGAGQLGPLQWQGTLSALWSQVPQVMLDLQLPLLDLAWFDRPSAAQESNKSSQTTTEPSLAWFKGINGEGRLRIGHLKGTRLDTRDLNMALQLEKGVLRLTEFSTRLYQGRVAATGMLDGTMMPARWQLAPKINQLQIQPLLKEWLGKEPLSGAATVQGVVNGVGLLPAAIRRTISGKLSVALADGSVNGYNLAAKLRSAKAMLHGETSAQEAKKTDFSALTADVQLQSGVASSNNISMQSPLLRVRGRGNTHLVRESLDFKLDVSVVATSKGQGGKGLESLAHLTIPLRISGTWSAPDYALDMGGQLRQGLQQQLKGIAPQRLPTKLGDLFN